MVMGPKSDGGSYWCTVGFVTLVVVVVVVAVVVVVGIIQCHGGKV